MGVARVEGWVGLLDVFGGDDHDLAEGSLKEALALNRELGNWAYGAYCLEGFAGLAGARGQGARAARLWGAAEALRTNIGAPLSLDARLCSTSEYGRRARSTRRGGMGSGVRPGDGDVSGRGRRVCSLRRGRLRCRRESAGRRGETDEPLTIDPLTAREREVAAMVAQGMSNRQIAQDLSSQNAPSRTTSPRSCASWISPRGQRSPPGQRSKG